MNRIKPGHLFAAMLVAAVVSAVMAREVAQDRPARPSPTTGSQPPADRPQQPAQVTACPPARTATAALETVDWKLTLDGQVAASRTAAVVYQADVLKQLKVKQVVAHGTTVKKGQVLLEPDREELDRQLDGQHLELEAEALALKKAELDLRHAEQTTPRKVESARIALERAAADLAWFLEKGKAMAVAQAKESIRSAEDRMVYAREELRQLEKMYKADDLTEETEEIILRRTRDNLRRAELARKAAELEGHKTLTVTIPRQEQDLKRSREEAAIAYEQARQSGPLELEQKRQALAQQRRAHEQAERAWKQRTADRDAQRLTAPMDGLVYYGSFTDDLWDGAGQLDLEPRAVVPAGKTVMTVVDPASIYVKVAVPEKDLHLVRTGQRVVVRPTGWPQRWLAGTVGRVGSVPAADGKFYAQVRLSGKPTGLLPGMTCRLEIQLLRRPRVLTIPAQALRPNGRPGQWVVLVCQDGTASKRPVKVELVHDGKAVISRGLKAGEKVCLEPAAAR